MAIANDEHTMSERRFTAFEVAPIWSVIGDSIVCELFIFRVCIYNTTRKTMKCCVSPPFFFNDFVYNPSIKKEEL